MRTDWVLIGRLARELEARLSGGRIQDAGLLPDGRTALVFRRGGERCVLAIDLFSSPPLVTLGQDELGILEEPGFVRTLARSLKGMALTSVAARRFDRLLRLRFSARSRFGVGEELDLYLELVPRFGNIVLVKGEIVVAAYKEFTPAENPRRAIAGGSPYALPPLPENPSTIDEPPEGSVLELFARARVEQTRHAQHARDVRRRDALLRRLRDREGKLRDELQGLSGKRAAAQRREELRARGESIFATLHTLAPDEREAAKELAGKLFAEYKKLGSTLPHIADRERAVGAALQIVDTLRWEAERAGSDDLQDVETAIDEMQRRKRVTPRPAARKRKRRMLELRTPRGSRIVVGRSPVENAELTFHLARPDDLWFHAQGVPGAHVILSRDDRARVPDEDLQAAASLAAFYSKAQAAASAPVDYTLRKHVRKQRAAPPGLVWYTHAKTIVTQPQSMDSLDSA
ncbi:MAG TPA: NFACT RNA binding domain-containing protein [Candidatus Cybelea sp.]|nr:NFACT RNA binding domain-containing protein [Candidatus Cybelea sp.]